MNDDSASRRGRPADRGGRPAARHDRPDRPLSNDRDPAFYDPRARDTTPPRSSAFSRHAYPPRQDPPPPPPRSYDAPLPPPGQGYYPEQPAPRLESPPPPSFAPTQPYQPEPSLQYGETRDDLFGRDPAPSHYDANAYPASDPYAGSYAPAPRRDDPYAQHSGGADDYARDYPRAPAPETGGQRFYAQDSQPRGLPQDRGYAPPPLEPDLGYGGQYAGGSYAPSSYNGGQPQPGAYGQESFDPRYGGHEGWSSDDLGLHDGRNLPQRVGHGDELDEDFFADEDDFDHDEHAHAPKRGRKKLIAAALVGAIGVGGGGAYLYKSLKGGSADTATPVIRADNRPDKGLPDNPGGRQYPNGEKTIYDRILPDGRQVQATLTPTAVPASPAFGTGASPGGNSLEDRIEEALKKAQQSGDAPQGQAQPGADRPTVVKPEVYRPDGSRVDPARPTVAPAIVNINGGGPLPPPFGPGPAAAPTQPAGPAPFRNSVQAPAAPAPAAKPAPVRQAALAADQAAPTATADGYYVSLKSGPDESAIQREIPSLVDKYKSALGDVQVVAKIADLGAKGVHYRAVAGPLGSRQEASDLCNKIKGLGGSCFVTK